MRYLLFLTLFLTGCSSGSDATEALLNDYSRAAALEADLTSFLAGEALESATQTNDLVAELGLTGYGVSTFSKTRQLGPALFESCLDVSATSFRNALGQPVLLDRKERQLVNVAIQDGLISEIMLVGEGC